MNCWDILEISSTGDRALIRKAYARLIKKFRPDESPEEFQKIHDAYQEALEEIRHGVLAAANMPEGDASTEIDDCSDASEEFLPLGMSREILARINEVIENMPNSEMMVEVDGYRVSRELSPERGFRIERIGVLDAEDPGTGVTEEYRQELDKVLAKLDEILAKPDAENADHWDFLADCPLLLDSEFRYQLTEDVLQRIAQYNLSGNGATKSAVGLKAMARLDRYLNFSSSSWEDYCQLSEREWNALRMPSSVVASPSAGHKPGRGVKGGKLLTGREIHYGKQGAAKFWLGMLKCSLLAIIAVVCLLGLVFVIRSGGGVILYILGIAAFVNFITAFLQADNNKL